MTCMHMMLGTFLHIPPLAVISIEENRETQDFDDNNNPERHEIAVVDNKHNSVRSEIKENTDEEVRNVNEMK